MTYQLLRQICNSTYTVGLLSIQLPPDICVELLASCCCNSVAFSLSMLCLNCQQGVGSGIAGDTGYDAAAGTYQKYLTGNTKDGSFCHPNINQSFPIDIQDAVCNVPIKIENDLYPLFWENGSWSYDYTREVIMKDQLALGNNTFTHCASTTINTTTNATGSSASISPQISALPNISPSPSRSSSSTSIAITGIVMGTVVILAVLVVFVWYSQRRIPPVRVEPSTSSSLHRTLSNSYYPGNSVTRSQHASGRQVLPPAYGEVTRFTERLGL